uniref:Uncharacterized protein n=1 Tax=Rhizophora mucronata TaxID=61149 RepID=A0A2P2NHZ8_RHIMU
MADKSFLMIITSLQSFHKLLLKYGCKSIIPTAKNSAVSIMMQLSKDCSKDQHIFAYPCELPAH